MNEHFPDMWDRKCSLICPSRCHSFIILTMTWEEFEDSVVFVRTRSDTTLVDHVTHLHRNRTVWRHSTCQQQWCQRTSHGVTMALPWRYHQSKETKAQCHGSLSITVVTVKHSKPQTQEIFHWFCCITGNFWGWRRSRARGTCARGGSSDSVITSNWTFSFHS